MDACVRVFAIALLVGQMGMARAADGIAQGKQECRSRAEPGSDAAACAAENSNRPNGDTEAVEMTVGSPPMQSDDTGTPGPGNWEINLGMYGDLTGGERLFDFPTIDINYGYGESVQFAFTLPVVFTQQAQPEANGIMRKVDGWTLGQSQVGVKYRFYDDKEMGLSFALYPQIQFRTPGAGKSVPGGNTVLAVPMLATWEFERVSVTANAGIEAAAGKHFTFASVGIGTRLTDRVALLAEVVGENLNAADEKVVLFDIGIRRKITDRQSVSAALGRDLDVGGDQHEHTYFAIAYQMLFGQH